MEAVVGIGTAWQIGYAHGAQLAEEILVGRRQLVGVPDEYPPLRT